MIPVYNDIQFLEILDKGGRNKPWLVRVLVNDDYQDYVVKIFDDNPDQFFTAAEVYGAVLASEFELAVPGFALFEIDGRNLYGFPSELQILAEEKGFGLKFGSKYIPGSQGYTVSLHKQQIQKRLAVDTLFAFDHLINNTDRNSNRPNVLVQDLEILVIDHELAFKGLNPAAQKLIESGNPINNMFRHHICFELLVRSTNSTKRDYFHTFEELLRVLNVNVLDPYEKQMASCGLPTGNFGEIKSFLEFSKRNHNNFVHIMKGLIR